VDVNLLVLRSQVAPRYLDGETVAKGVLNYVVDFPTNTLLSV
jgi:hypothetical protein